MRRPFDQTHGIFYLQHWSFIFLIHFLLLIFFNSQCNKTKSRLKTFCEGIIHQTDRKRGIPLHSKLNKSREHVLCASISRSRSRIQPRLGVNDSVAAPASAHGSCQAVNEVPLSRAATVTSHFERPRSVTTGPS